MNYLFIIFSVIVSLGSLKYAFKQRNQKLFLKRKYSPIKDIDQYVIEEKEKLNKEKLFLEDLIRKERFDSENVIKEEKIELANNKLIFENSIKEKNDELYKKKKIFEKEINESKSLIENLKNEEKDCQNVLQEIKSRLELSRQSEELLLLECGYSEPKYDFQHEKKWKEKLYSFKYWQKEMIKSFPYQNSRKISKWNAGIFQKNLVIAFDTQI